MTSQAAHHLMFQFEGTFYLLLGKKLRVLLVVLLAQVENLLALLHASFVGLLSLGLSGGVGLMATNARSQCPHIVLVSLVGNYILLRGGIVKG